MTILLPAASGRCRYCDDPLPKGHRGICAKMACRRKSKNEGHRRYRYRLALTSQTPRDLGLVPSQAGRATKERTLVCPTCHSFVEWVNTLNGFGAVAEKCRCGLRWPSPVPPLARPS